MAEDRKTVSVDVAVIAAGPAGLAAAIAAVEKGAGVCVFEKAAAVGGAANMGMGVFGVESRLQKRSMINLTKEEAFKRFMEYEHWKVDANLVRNYFWRSGDTVNWLEDMGVQFAAAAKYFPESEPTWHLVKPPSGMPGPRAAGAMVKIMQERAEELGVKFYMETPAIKINRDEYGVSGFDAAGADGTQYAVEAEATVVATGGFGDSPEMIYEECGLRYGKDIFSNRIPGLKGDGLRMAWAVGAARSDIDMELILDSGIPMMTYMGAFAFRQPGVIVVNRLGERVMNEEVIQNTSVTANIVKRQPGMGAYAVMTDEIVKRYQKNGLDYPPFAPISDPLRDFEKGFRAAEEGYPESAFSANSPEVLAERMGVDKEAFCKAVMEYNRACELHYDDRMCKSRRYLYPLKGKTFYAERVALGAYGSLGGIKVNSKLEVVDESGRAIPGLYGAGSDVNNLYAGTYMFYFPGSTMGFAVNSGRMAGENAADFVLEA